LQSGPRGWLRITAPYSLGTTWIAPLLGEFQARHPEVRVEMVLNNDLLDLIEKEIDVALRIGNLPDSNLVARKLAVLRTAVYASPSYIERFGEPLHPDDLQHHRVLFMQKGRDTSGFTWKLNDGSTEADFAVDPVMMANDPAPLRGALLCGEGLMFTGDAMVRAYVEHGLLQRVLAGWRGPDFDLNAVFPRGHVQSPKVRAFVDFLVERLNLDEGYMQVMCEDTERCQHLANAAAAVDAAAIAEHTVAEELKRRAAAASAAPARDAAGKNRALATPGWPTLEPDDEPDLPVLARVAGRRTGVQPGGGRGRDAGCGHGTGQRRCRGESQRADAALP
jgi:DNA-binding transcriptional LysR family regulator